MSILGDLVQLLKFSLSSFVVPGSAPSKSNSALMYYVYMTYIHEEERALLDFDGAEPGTTNEESENLRNDQDHPIST